MTVVCAVFVGFLASAWWNPTERTGNVGVLLVNEDAGFVVPSGPNAGEKVLLGAKVAAAMTAAVATDGEPLFEWSTAADRNAALKGLDDGDYVLAIVIPPEFSLRLATLGALATGAPLEVGERATAVSAATSESAPMEIIVNQAGAPFEVSLITAMAQQVVQKAADQANAELVAQMLASTQAASTDASATATDSELGTGDESSEARSLDPRAYAIAQPIVATVTPINEIDRYGKAIGLIFFMLFLAIGGLAPTVAAHLVTRDMAASKRFPAGVVLGRWLGLLLPAAVLAAACTACIHLFGFSMKSAATTYGIALLGVLAFTTFNLMLGSIFGPVGLPVAVFCVPLQVAAGGAMMGAELTPGFYQAVSAWIPYTYALEGVRQGMFGGGTADAAAGALVLVTAICLGLALGLCFVPGLFRKRSRAVGNSRPALLGEAPLTPDE